MFFSCTVYTTGIKLILGNINAEKILENCSTQGFSHCITSIVYVAKAGYASLPILHRDKDSETQSTYYGSGRQGTHCTEGSMTQEVYKSSCLSIVNISYEHYMLIHSYNMNSW
jgi:hypothetical protein